MRPGKRAQHNRVMMRRYERVKAWLWGQKSHPCMDCGGSFHPVAMQFDHIPERGPKSFSIGNQWSKGIPALAAEIAKCDLVCANCHAVRTHLRREIG